MTGLSILIVYYNTPRHLTACLNSIFAFKYGFPVEILVIDNSYDLATRDTILHEHPSVRWIDMGYNAGFARANNKGFEHAKHDVVLLLNSDTIIIEDAINLCYDKLIKSDHIAAGVQLINIDGTPQITGNYFTIGGLNSLLALPFFGKLLKGVALLIGVKKPHQLNIQVESLVDWINGAFIMVKRSAVTQAGLLDTDFFLFSEEIEWCSRLRKVGTLCVYGQAHVIHAQGESTSQTFNLQHKGYAHLDNKMGLQVMLSSLLRIRKQYGFVWYLVHQILYTLEIPFYWVGSFWIILNRKSPFSLVLKSAVGYSRNVLKLWRYFPAISARKRFLYKVL